MSRPTDWLPLNLGMDPVPGDWSAVSSASTRYGGIADAIERAKTDLLRVFEDEAISGEAIDAVRETAIQVADRIGRAKKRYRGVADALAGYVEPLHTAQDRSVEILNQAIGIGGNQTQARTKVEEWERKYYQATTPEELEDAQKWRDHWQQELWDAETAVSQAVSALNQVLSDRDAAAETAANLIEDVENSGDLNDGFWDNVDQFLDENPWIDTALEWAGYVAAALAIIAMFVPGLNLIVLAVAITLAAATILNAWAKAGTGRSSIGEAIFTTALAVIPFGVGARLNTLATMARGGVVKTAVNSITASAASRGMTGITDDIVLEFMEMTLARTGGRTESTQLAALAALFKTYSPTMDAAVQAANTVFDYKIVAAIAEPVVNKTVEILDLHSHVPNNSWQNSDW